MEYWGFDLRPVSSFFFKRLQLDAWDWEVRLLLLLVIVIVILIFVIARIINSMKNNKNNCNSFNRNRCYAIGDSGLGLWRLKVSGWVFRV